MDFVLDAGQRQLRSEIVRFARRTLNEGVIDRDRDQVFDRDLWSACAGMGLLGAPVPENLGGAGLSPLDTAIALEALGYGCRDGGLAFSVAAHLLAVVVPIWKHGSDAQHARWLPGLCDGTVIGVHGMTEPGSGSDAFALATTAVAEGDAWILNGTKTFASNGPVADVALVFALTDRERGYHGGITAFLVDTRTPGFRAGRKIEKMGLRTSPMGELVLEDVRVQADAVLGGVGAGANLFADSMNWERVCLFATHVGAMERLLETAIAYARTRQQYGQPIGRFQAVAHRIADMKVRLEAARLLLYRAASQLDQSRTVALDAAIAKLFISESLLASAQDTVRVLGGYGYTTEYEVERALRDAMGATLYSGTSDVQKNIIARWLGL